MRLRRSFGGLIVMLLAVAACGDGGSDGGDDDNAADDRAAAAAAIAAFEDTVRDRGFKPSADDDDDDDDLEFESTDCQRFEETLNQAGDKLPGETASKESDDFEKGEFDPRGGVAEMVQGNVGFVEDEGKLAETLDLLRDDRLGPCIEEAFRITVEKQAKQDNVPFTMGALDTSTRELRDIGEEAVGIDLKGSFSVLGFKVPFGFDLAFARDGRTAAMAMVTAIGDDDPREDAGELVELLLDEADAA